MIEVAFQSNPHAFLDKCGKLLEKDEVEHNLILTLSQSAEEKQKRGEKTDIRCAVVSDDEGFVVAALQTPPHNLVLSRAAHTSIAPLAEKLAEQKFSFPGIVGPSDVTSAFAARWTELTGQKSVEYMDQIIYALKSVILPPPVEGEMRFATAKDVKQVAAWIGEFSKSALPKAEQIDAAGAKAQAEALTKENRMAFWVVKGKPVAQASFSGTSAVARINRVYTPPENRGQGFASALVAHLSQSRLDAGARLCCLYADARNTKANSIYRKIGYEVRRRSSLYVLAKSS